MIWRCIECRKEFTEEDMIVYCDEHNDYFHQRCAGEHSQNRHGAYYREAQLREGKMVLI